MTNQVQYFILYFILTIIMENYNKNCVSIGFSPRQLVLPLSSSPKDYDRQRKLQRHAEAFYFIFDKKTEPKKIKSLKRLCCECSSRHPQFSDRLTRHFDLARACFTHGIRRCQSDLKSIRKIKKTVLDFQEMVNISSLKDLQAGFDFFK